MAGGWSTQNSKFTSFCQYFLRTVSNLNLLMIYVYVSLIVYQRKSCHRYRLFAGIGGMKDINSLLVVCCCCARRSRRSSDTTTTYSEYFFSCQIYTRSLVCLCFFSGVFLSSRVTGACPVTEHLIVRVNVRTTTTNEYSSMRRGGTRKDRRECRLFFVFAHLFYV